MDDSRTYELNDVLAKTHALHELYDYAGNMEDKANWLTCALDRLVHISDRGHGWLIVDKLIFNLLRIGTGEYANYSYTDGEVYYLEEDVHMPKFLAVLDAWDLDYQVVGVCLDSDFPKDSRPSFNRIHYPPVVSHLHD